MNNTYYYPQSGQSGQPIYTVNTIGTSPTSFNNANIDLSYAQVNGRSLTDIFVQIEKRLSILVPDPELLEKYTALQDLYEQYKTMEALVMDQAKKK